MKVWESGTGISPSFRARIILRATQRESAHLDTRRFRPRGLLQPLASSTSEVQWSSRAWQHAIGFARCGLYRCEKFATLKRCVA